MACSRKKERKRPRKGWYVCQECGQARKKKRKLCDPKKVKT